MGKGGHAAKPQETVDPVLMSSNLVMALQSIASRNTNPTKDIESEIAALSNDKNGPYWNRTHPDHDKVVQQVYTLREMLNAK